MAGNGDRNGYGAAIAIVALLATVVGGALSFQARIGDEVRVALASELKHTVTREELAEFRRQQEGHEVRWRLDVLKRLENIDYQIKLLRRER